MKQYLEVTSKASAEAESEAEPDKKKRSQADVLIDAIRLDKALEEELADSKDAKEQLAIFAEEHGLDLSPDNYGRVIALAVKGFLTLRPKTKPRK